MCMACGQKGSDTKKLLRCSRCKDAWFCNASCQKSMWPIHKQYCQKLVSNEYNITPQTNKVRDIANEISGADIRADSSGKVVYAFTPSATENDAFLHLLIKNAHVDVEGKYGFNPFTESGRAAMATCPLSDDSPTDDVPKLIMSSIMGALVSGESTDVSGVLVLTDEDPKYYLMMKNGRKYIKSRPGTPGYRSTIEDQSGMYSVVKVLFCLGNSNIKLDMFLRDSTKARVLHAKDKRTIIELKRHLEKNATATDQVISCPMRGSSRVYEGYLDMQNLD